MAYCVNCGVHLNDRVILCPLCQTEVINPRSQPINHSLPRPMLQTEEPGKGFDRNLWIKLMSITLVTPAIISVIIDWIFQRPLSWSLYVTASLMLAWTWSISPFFFRQNRLLKWIPIGMITLLGFLFSIEQFSNSQGWFITIGLPITVSFFVIFAILTILINQKVLRELRIPSAILIAVGLFCVCINASISLYKNQTIRLDWSLIVCTTCIAFGLIGLVLQQRPWIVEEIKYWFRM